MEKDISSDSFQRFEAPRFDRSMPLGYDRYGSQYWLLEAQASMTIGSLNSLASKSFVEPCVIVRDPDGWFGRHSGLGLQHLFDLFSPDIECERFLRNSMIERIHYTKKTLSKSMLLKPGAAQVDWLKRICSAMTFCNAVEQRNLDGIPNPTYLMVQLENHWMRCVDIRIMIHVMCMLRSTEKEEEHAQKSERSGKEAISRKISKFKIAWLEEGMDLNNKGYFRQDSFQRIRELMTSTSASRIHADPYNFFPLFKKQMLESQVLKMLDEEMAYHNEDDGVSVQEHEETDKNNEVPEELEADAVPMDVDTNSKTMDSVAGNVDEVKVNPNPNEDKQKASETEMEVSIGAKDDSTDESRKDVQKATTEHDDGSNVMQQMIMSKAIEQLNSTTGDVLAIYPSYLIAASHMKIPSADILQCCKQNFSECGGFKWRFYDGPDVDCK